MGKTDNFSTNKSDKVRKELRWQRRFKLWQSAWRLVFLSSLSVGLFWTMKLPYWYVRGDEQIEVKGNHLMREDDVRSLISLDYPQYLWRLDTNKIIKQLESTEPIVSAQITRQLFPSRVNIRIQERQPIALVLSPKLDKKTAAPSKLLLGFLDREGIFIPEHFYRYSQSKMVLPRPTLTVIGFEPQYQPYFLEICSFIEKSHVKIFEIEWREPTSIFLKTKLGIFYLGNYPTQISKQLQIVEKMEEAGKQIDMSKVEYIDLSNPDLPSLKLKS